MEIPTGKHLKRCRKSLGLTQNELSQLSGIAQSVIAKVENESVDPRSSTLKKIVLVMIVMQIFIKICE